MAKEKEEKKEKNKDEKNNDPQGKVSSPGILTWIVLAAVMVIFAGTGIFLGRLFAKPPQAAVVPAAANSVKQDIFEPVIDASADESQSWFYDLDPVVANLDEPGVTRYIRAALTVEVSSKLEQKSAAALFDKKKPLITNWLTIYLASLRLDEIRGDENLRRIQSRIVEMINENLFGDSEPMIKNVLFKEFAIQ